MVGGQTQPVNGGFAILRHTISAQIHDTQVVLGVLVTLLCGLAVPAHRLCLVQHHPVLTGFVKHAHVVLRHAVARLGVALQGLEIHRDLL